MARPPQRQVARRRMALMGPESAAALGAIARAVVGQVAKTAESRKRKRTATKRTTSTKKRKSRVKIGSYAGKLIASKPVAKPKVGARVRERQFGDNGEEGVANRAWFTGSTVGSEYYFTTLIAEAMTIQILRAIGDYRTDKQNPDSIMFSELRFVFGRDDVRKGSSTAAQFQVDMLIANDQSFDGIVRNEKPTAGFYNVVNYVTGGEGAQTQPGPSPGLGLNRVLWEMALRGFYPTGVAVFRGTQEIYRDHALDKASLTMDIKGLFKFQNITPADSTGSAENNANAIDANPLSGKIATFRNLSPCWNKGWLNQQSDRNSLENASGRPQKADSWHYAQCNASGVYPDIPELQAMPARMRTVFSNAKTSSPVHFPPGGYKTFNTSFTYKGSLYRAMRDLTQQIEDEEGSASEVINGKYPSLGDSFALCLVPTMKSQVNEPVKVQFDYQRDGFASVSKYRGGSLPTTNIFQ